MEIKIKDVDGTIDLSTFWTNQGIILTPNSCERGYRLADTWSFLTIDDATHTITLSSNSWLDLGIYSTTVYLYWKDLPDTSNQISIPLNFEIKENCAEPATWTVLPSDIKNHQYAYTHWDITADSLAI